MSREIFRTGSFKQMGKTQVAIKIGDIIVPLFLAFGVGAVFSLICGTNPFTLYGYIIKRAFFSLGGILNTLGYATPIIITGMATSLSLKAKVFNMGVEGQVFVGAFTAALAGYMITGLPTVLHTALCLLIAAAAGMLYAAVPGILKAKLNVNEVVTTIMLNSIATIVTGFLTQSYVGTKDTYAHTQNILQTARLAKLDDRYRCTTAIFIALFIWALVYFLMKKTKFGYDINCIGKQMEFSDAVGMRVSRKIIQIFVLGGALGGIAGATEIMGVNYNFVSTFSANPGIGWDGFFACILAGSNPTGVLIYAVVFGALRYGALAAQTGLGVPLDLINIVKSTLVLFMALKLFANHKDAIIGRLFKVGGKTGEGEGRL